MLAVHSATGFSGYAASDRVPERIAAMVYVDTAPGIPPLDPDFTDAEKPLDWADIEAEANLDGLSEEQKATFRERGVPVPGGVLLATRTRSPTMPVETSRARSSAPATPPRPTGSTPRRTPRRRRLARHPGAADAAGDPGRHADQPLADVVQAGGAPANRIAEVARTVSNPVSA